MATLEPPDSLFSMSVFSGLLAMRTYSADHPGILSREIIGALSRVFPDEAHHNYQGALFLYTLVPAGGRPQDIPAFFRQVPRHFDQRDKAVVDSPGANGTRTFADGAKLQ